MSTSLDSFDQKILTIMQRDCSIKAEVIAEAIGLSASAVQKRLKRLRAEKIITAEVAVLDRALVGRPMSFVAAMEIERDNYDTVNRFREWAKQIDAIQQIYYVTGAADLIVIITAQDVEAYDRLTARVMENNPMIRRITTNVVLNTLKTSLFIPVEGDGQSAADGNQIATK